MLTQRLHHLLPVSSVPAMADISESHTSLYLTPQSPHADFRTDPHYLSKIMIHIMMMTSVTRRRPWRMNPLPQALCPPPIILPSWFLCRRGLIR